jgi:hypothetical protein
MKPNYVVSNFTFYESVLVLSLPYVFRMAGGTKVLLSLKTNNGWRMWTEIKFGFTLVPLVLHTTKCFFRFNTKKNRYKK